MISGTWSINEFVSDAPVISREVQMNSLFCLEGKYLIEESSATSAGNSEWFLKRILRAVPAEGKSIYDLANEAVESLPPEEPVPVFLPFLMASNVNPDAMGAFVGLSEHQDHRHLVRAVYEGVAFCHRWHYEKLLRSRKEPVTEIRLAGGAARSAVWTRIFADVMGVPVVTVDAAETGALGCAIAAAVASGVKPSVERAVTDMVRFGAPVWPDPERTARYERRYALYRRTIEALDPVWADYRAMNTESQ